MATYYGPSIAFIVAYLQNVALKKMLRPPSIHFEKCFAPLPPSLKNALPHAYVDLLYSSSIACPLSCQEGFVHRADKGRVQK